jgi:hypothetical protein
LGLAETQLASSLSRNEALYCVETPERRELDEREGAWLMVVWANLLVSPDGTRRRFGAPYVTLIPRETAYADLQKILLKEMAPILAPGILVSEQKVRISYPSHLTSDPT